jgi:hypothetical protein
LELLAARPDMTGLQAQLYFDRAIDLAAVAAETCLKELGRPVPSKAIEKIANAMAELEDAGRRGLPDIEDMDFGVEVRNRSVHETKVDRAARAQLKHTFTNVRKLLRAIGAEVLGQARRGER